MSFQDVGKSKRSINNNQQKQQQALGGSVTDSFVLISDNILQYQKNVGLLEKIVKQVGTKSPGRGGSGSDDDYNLLETQYKVQVGVLQEIGSKIEKQLKVKNDEMSNFSREEASKRRTTLIKLTKDYNRVIQTNKNLQLEYKRRITNVISNQHNHMVQQQQQYESSLRNSSDQQEQQQQRQQLELQLQQDKLNEEIMRERQEEIRNINKGMSQVNEIYKDLAHIVGEQQEQIDQVENQMEETKTTTEAGLEHIQKANEHNNASQCIIS